MQRTYLRYVPEHAFGVIATPRGNSLYAEGDQLALTPSLRDVGVWHLKQGSLLRRLTPESTTPGTEAEEVASLTLLPGGRVAAGYTSGVLRVFDYKTGTQELAFHGHRSAVTCADGTADGAFLATGASDTDVVVWDAVAETGVCRLRGHRGAVTAVAFLQPKGSGGNGAGFFGVVSASQDALVKVWDVAAQHCLQTVTGHRAEVWALALNPGATRLVTGSEDNHLRVFRVRGEEDVDESGGDGNAIVAANGESGGASVVPALTPMGAVARQLTDKVNQLAWHPSSRYLGVLVPGKALEVFHVRDADESKRKMKRRLRKAKAKGEKEKEKEGGGDDATAVVPAAAAAPTLTAADEMEFYALLRSNHKIRSFAFQNSAAAAKGATNVLLSLHNNSLEVHSLPLRHGAGKGGSTPLITVGGAGESPKAEPSVTMPVRTMVLDMHGHRSDVRAVDVSRDGTLVASVSAYSVKVWNLKTQNCIRSAAVGGLALCCAFAPGDRHVVVGTREGCLCILDIGSGDVIENVQAHEGAVWDIALRPDNTGLASASADKSVKFWDFELQAGGNLGILHARTLALAEDALCVRFSHTQDRAKLLVCVSLLDCTVKVFYDDTLRFFLSLYGHKLPALAMAISYDNQVLVTGSADKTIKIWGLDFGDCHKSIFAHDDSVMGLHFVHGSHLFFSVSKDRTLKYWDADSYDNVLTLRGHTAEVWALAVSRDGAAVVTGSHDRSIRVWARTQEPVFIEEERENELERVFDGELNRDAREDDANEKGGGGGDDDDDDDDEDVSNAPTTKRSLETITSGERLLEALEIAHQEWATLRAHEEAVRKAAAAGKPAPEAPAPSVLLLGLHPVAYVLRALRMVKAQHLEQALLVASFSQAEVILEFCAEVLASGLGVEIVSRAVVLLLRAFTVQITSSTKLRPALAKIQAHLRPELGRLRDTIGVNQAALEHIQRRGQEKGARRAPEDEGAAPGKKQRTA